jgi:hypothetical protein
METMLRPRDIQARIRAGATPEAVAEAACSSLDKVMTYAAPVLAEREHVAQTALRASLRRASGDQHAAGRTLGEAVSARLRAMNIHPDAVLWDAWRREDGRWALTAAFSARGYDGLAEMTFDQRGNFVTIDNDEARWLIGDPVEEAPQEGAHPAAAGEAEPPVRALSSVPAAPSTQRESTELGSDAIELVSEPEPRREAPPAPRHEALDSTIDVPLIDLPPLGAPGDESPSEPAVLEAPAEPEPAEPAAESAPEPSPAARRKRMSVPSWDEILFGGADQPS